MICPKVIERHSESLGLLFWQKAFKSIAYGDVQSVRIFVSEMGMAKQCQLNTMMVLTIGHEGI